MGSGFPETLDVHSNLFALTKSKLRTVMVYAKRILHKEEKNHAGYL